MISKVNNEVWDLDRPLEGDCSIVFLKFDDEEAQAVSLEFFVLFVLFFCLGLDLCFSF